MARSRRCHMKWLKWSSLIASLIALGLLVATIAMFRMDVNAAAGTELPEIAPLRASPAVDARAGPARHAGRAGGAPRHPRDRGGRARGGAPAGAAGGEMGGSRVREVGAGRGGRAGVRRSFDGQPGFEPPLRGAAAR